jgi:hypothetical protein
MGPPFVDIHTLYNSGGNIPEEVLRGCGVPEDFIIYARVGRPLLTRPHGER